MSGRAVSGAGGASQDGRASIRPRPGAPFPFGALEAHGASLAAFVVGLDVAAILLTTFTVLGLRDDGATMNDS